MGENGHQSREYWSIDIVQENNVEEVLEPGTHCCIYRVPRYIRKIKEEVYTPKSISIGPLHYGRIEFMGMENQKKRFWSKFWERVNNAQKLMEFKTYVKNQEQHIRNNYSVSSSLQSSEYIAMIQHDAVFIIELFVRNYNHTEDFLLNSSLGMSIKADLLLLENQVPFFVLNHLCMETFPVIEGNPSFFKLSVFYFIEIMRYNTLLLLEAEPQVEHFTDLLRCAFVMGLQPAQSNGRPIDNLPTATKLNNSGLNFRGIYNECPLDITLEKRKRGNWLPWFEVQELQIPRIQIFDETEGIFRNMMALEMFHYRKETHVCNYASLMEYLIDTVKDVDLLIEKDIIVNYVGGNEVIAKMFHNLGKYMILSNSRYYDIVKQMKLHYSYPWNYAKATLTDKVTFAATFVMILAVIQTVCSIKQIF